MIYLLDKTVQPGARNEISTIQKTYEMMLVPTKKYKPFLDETIPTD